jgi:uncharacterized protein involved in exopolysaccharide biosynthesis
LLTAFLGLLTSLALWIVLPQTYTSEAAVLPSSRSDVPAAGSLYGLAGSLGLNLGNAVPESYLYPPILKSERTIRNVLSAPLRADHPGSPTFFDLLSDSRDPERLRMEKAISFVRREVLSVSLDQMTGTVRISVRMHDPALAEHMAALFVESLESYMRDERTFRARRNLEFVRSRRANAESELRESEQALREFHENNRRIEDSPKLLLAEWRLSRDLRSREEVFLELTRQQELARIEAARATPILEVLDPPTVRIVPDAPKLPILLGIGLLSGAILGSLVAVVLEDLQRARQAGFASLRMLAGFRT